MARTKKSSVKPEEKREVSRKVINGAFIIFFDDGSIQIIAKPIDLTKEEVSSLFGSSEEEEEEVEEDALIMEELDEFGYAVDDDHSNLKNIEEEVPEYEEEE